MMNVLVIFLVSGSFIMKSFAGGPSLNPSLVEIFESFDMSSLPSTNGSIWGKNSYIVARI